MGEETATMAQPIKSSQVVEVQADLNKSIAKSGGHQYRGQLSQSDKHKTYKTLLQSDTFLEEPKTMRRQHLVSFRRQTFCLPNGQQYIFTGNAAKSGPLGVIIKFFKFINFCGADEII